MDQLTFRGPQLATMVDQHVGEKIRQRRTLLGYTQEQLAEALGISYQQIQKYETAANRISAGRLFQIARRLEVDVATFFEGLEDFEKISPADEENAHASSSRSIIELVRCFQSIEDDSLRTSILALVRNTATAVSETDRPYTNGNGVHKTTNGQNSAETQLAS